MKCVQCDHEGLQATTTNHDVRIGDRKIQVAVAATKCPQCSEVYVNGGTMERAEMLVAEHVARSGAVSGELSPNTSAYILVEFLRELSPNTSAYILVEFLR